MNEGIVLCSGLLQAVASGPSFGGVLKGKDKKAKPQRVLGPRLFAEISFTPRSLLL